MNPLLDKVIDAVGSIECIRVDRRSTYICETHFLKIKLLKRFKNILSDPPY